MIDQSLLPDFIAETVEHLDEMEINLLQLESTPRNRELLNNVFRAMHTIKGSAEYLGMKKIAEISHKLENLLEILRNGEKPLDKSVINILIEARDRILLLIYDLQKDQKESTEIHDLVERIARLSNEPDHTAEDRKSPTSSGCDLEQVSKAMQVKRDAICRGSWQNDTDDLKDHDLYNEELDEELFEIFIEQLKDNIRLLHRQVSELRYSDNPHEILNQCFDSISIIKSSANYMGYDKLIRLYDTWQNEIRIAQKELAAGKEASLDFMTEYMEKIFKRFPQVKPENNDSDTFDLPDLQLLSNRDNGAEIAKTGTGHPEDEEFIFNMDQFDLSEDQKAALEARKTSDSDEELELFSADANAPPVKHGITDGFAVAQIDSATLNDSSTEKRSGLKHIENHAIISAIETAFDEFTNSTECQDSSVLFGPIENYLFSVNEADSDPATDCSIHDELAVEEQLFSQEASDSKPEDNDGDDLDHATTDEPQNTQPASLSSNNNIEDGRQVQPDIAKAEFFRDHIIKQRIRVDAEKIDALMNQVGELVVSRAWFSLLHKEMKAFQQQLKASGNLTQKEMKSAQNLTFQLSEASTALSRTANEIQEGVMKIRMLPIAQLFNRYPRLVRDLVQDTNKQVRLEFKGEETELDKMVIEQLSDPLLHIIRNAVDHGIETAEERQHAGKTAWGTLKLESYHESSHVVIQITDDGNGIDTNRIKKTALKKHFLSESELDQMTSQELIELIMQPGFSTSDRITKTSGRGVGMDVVKKNIEKLNGTIEIDSKAGKETRIRIKIPLTLAIIPALLVRVGDEIFTIPLATVYETIRIFNNQTSKIEGIEVIQLRDYTLPLVRLNRLFSNHLAAPKSEDSKAFVVVVSTGMRKIGLVVDALLGQEEVVIKPLADYLRENSGFAGATILGDGRISLILDVYELVNLTISRQTKMMRVH